MNGTHTVLIANRGEIALRIHRGAKALGMRTVAVFVGDDRAARHVRLADEARELLGERGYLDVEQLLDVARDTGVTLVHPGYGFLSESAQFAAACADAGLTFVGPSSAALATLGDKASARALAVSLGVPVLPATEAGVSPAEAAEFFAAQGAGAAVVVKAVAGGGGRGMRVVTDPADLEFAFARCRSEAERAFGNGDVYVERYLPRARHIEVQLLGDGTGDVVHLWDRDCSVQRRHQKVIELAPALTLPTARRAPLLAAARELGAAVGYAGAGTVEFLVDADDPADWFFLEANPRLQVEHPVTEAVTGVDVVAAQLRIAAGATLAGLGLTQERIAEPRGAALECRVNLEEIGPDGIARAASGEITGLDLPSGPGVRVDAGGYVGMRAGGAYDSLLAKIVVHTAETDLVALADAAERALAELHVAGTATNAPVLRAILGHETFRSGAATTAFLDARAAEFAPAAARGASAGPAGVLSATFPGTVTDVPVRVGDTVAVGDPLVVVEAMKMEHVLVAAASGTVAEIRVVPGDVVADEAVLVVLDVDGEQRERVDATAEIDLDAVRDDLAEVIERHRIGLDEARPEAVAKRRRIGRRTARENIADLCDDGSFTEYGALAVAAQRQRRALDDLIANTPADGIITGVGRINGEGHPSAARCAVLSYDYTVLAGTQGVINHRKTDRALELAERTGLPVVLFAEGGGGRPGDTDTTMAAGLDVATFATMGRLSGSVPLVGIASGRCFAGNAALLGCCDVIIATRDATIGMGGPAMIEGGGLGVHRPEEVGPVDVQAPNGVIDVVAEDDADAVAVAKRYLSYFQGDLDAGECADQRLLRHVVPENRVRVYDIRRAVELLADTGSVLELRREFGLGVITALARIDGRAVGLVANNPAHLGGAIDVPAADKLARFLQLCDAHGLPIVSLTDTPGFMVGPDAERTATVRHFARLFVGGANLTVPVAAIVTRKAYGLGAMAMFGGGAHSAVGVAAWPTGELGAMGLEGAVRLGFRRELEAIADHGERRAAFDALLAQAYARGKATAVASVFEIDDVIDPAQTRRWLGSVLPAGRTRGGRGFVDTW